MAFQRSPAAWAPGMIHEDARLTDLFTDGDADIQLAGVPHDAAVIGRKGARDGPTGIREAFRFVAGHDIDTGHALRRTIKDHGDVAPLSDDVLETHATVRETLRPIMGDQTIILGGDHGLTFAHIAALADAVEGRIGIVVVDAHYDLRSYTGQPTSGTPFRRIIDELDGRVSPRNIAEIGIRPYANARSLAHYAHAQGISIHSMADVRDHGIVATTQEALAAAGHGVDHLWLSIDIDGIDQSIASGCSAPGAGGLQWHHVEHIIRTVAADPRCRGMDILEVAPSLDPTGNTTRTAAQLVGTFVGAR